MTLVKWHRNENDLPVLSNYFENFLNRDFDDFFGNSISRKIPAANVVENENDFRIEIAAPGLAKDDFKINLENNLITIEASKENKQEEHDERYTRKEFCYNSFRRSFTLPNTIEHDRIDAKYQDGILHIIIPKKEEAKKKPAREISVN